jgi:hypothetical protein
MLSLVIEVMSLAKEIVMPHHISGQLHWDTTHAATLCWLLFLDGQADDAPRMLPEYDTRTSQQASPDELARLIGAMLQRDTGHLPRQVQVTPIEAGQVYAFVALGADPR